MVFVVTAEEDGAKLDPTRKFIVYGGVEAEATTSYTLLWDQVIYDALILLRVARSGE